MAPYEELLAWQHAHALTLRIYALSATWPAAERFGLVAQIRRAAVSVPANIAEGVIKHGPKEFRRFLDIALGSQTEVRYLLRLAGDLGYLSTPELAGVTEAAEEAGRLLWGLYRSMKARA
ncbi:MAG TPA: four helix bundle protein [Gemmatimonadales bacterium]|jgi:four helix bundle protein|nr:four helix bundle protein [Gemmatimonadales bacterium]